MTKQIFDTDRRIRLGIWGLGRGMSFYQTCQYLNIDVVAGCDYNEHMRQRFAKDLPDALVTADQDEFLAADLDAVLLATFCPAHADDAIACLRAGKHVLSEVTAFHTMGEGVRLVEEVERSGLVYNLAENYPWSAANMYLARKWREGLFGDLMYAEYEYLHEIRQLAYTYIDGLPVTPGWSLHNWRSWLNFHYYNTHSLGPMMVITGTRPVRVTALLGEQRLPGYPLQGGEGMGCVAPSLISMDNGGVVRNLMGATTNDGHLQRFWGTRGAAEIVDGKLRLRLGGGGGSPRMEVEPSWDELGELAAGTGHGGGDFWVLYYFARQILFGDAAPFDIYAASDCTIPGILAYRSSRENGRPYDIPDFRNPAEREPWRNDDFACPRLDTHKGLWPEDLDRSVVAAFNHVMKDLNHHALHYRGWADWAALVDDVQDKAAVAACADRLLERFDDMVNTVRQAKEMVAACPSCEGARVLRELLEMIDVDIEAPDARAGIISERDCIAQLAQQERNND